MSTFFTMTTTYTEHVSAEVRAEMGRQRIPQAYLAAQLGWSQPTLSRRLRGEVAFSTLELEILAGILGVPVSQFTAFTAGAV